MINFSTPQSKTITLFRHTNTNTHILHIIKHRPHLTNRSTNFDLNMDFMPICLIDTIEIWLYQFELHYFNKLLVIRKEIDILSCNYMSNFANRHISHPIDILIPLIFRYFHRILVASSDFSFEHLAMNSFEIPIDSFSLNRILFFFCSNCFDYVSLLVSFACTWSFNYNISK